mmetsp:Transcript_34821/g.74168  ORF Transcript_34821/g.74168 Transcript_34821/m.74168 type:complete len:404 (-) Transcript_34821:57-1268(-)
MGGPRGVRPWDDLGGGGARLEQRDGGGSVRGNARQLRLARVRDGRARRRPLAPVVVRGRPNGPWSSRRPWEAGGRGGGLRGRRDGRGSVRRSVRGPLLARGRRGDTRGAIPSPGARGHPRRARSKRGGGDRGVWPRENPPARRDDAGSARRGPRPPPWVCGGSRSVRWGQRPSTVACGHPGSARRGVWPWHGGGARRNLCGRRVRGRSVRRGPGPISMGCGRHRSTWTGVDVPPRNRRRSPALGDHRRGTRSASGRHAGPAQLAPLLRSGPGRHRSRWRRRHGAGGIQSPPGRTASGAPTGRARTTTGRRKTSSSTRGGRRGGTTSTRSRRGGTPGSTSGPCWRRSGTTSTGSRRGGTAGTRSRRGRATRTRRRSAGRSSSGSSSRGLPAASTDVWPTGQKML